MPAEPYYDFHVPVFENYAACGVWHHNTGKSYAYLLPAILLAVQKRDCQVVVAAPTIALQDQLVQKDLPALRKILPFPFTYALLKGKSNFLCRQRAADWAKRLESDEDGGGEMFEGRAKRLERLYNGITVQDFEAFESWRKSTSTGDKNELPFEPHADLWREVCGSSEECSRCPETCFARMHRDKAKVADVIVTNYHVLFAHLVLKAEQGRNILLPQLGLVILDEAHELPEIARKFFGFDLRVSSILRQAKLLQKESVSEDLGVAIADLTADVFREINAHCVEQRTANLHRKFEHEGQALVRLFERAVDHWLSMCHAAARAVLDLMGPDPDQVAFPALVLPDQPKDKPKKKGGDAKKQARAHSRWCTRQLASCEKITWQLRDAFTLAADLGTASPRAYWLDGYADPDKFRGWSVGRLTLSAVPVDVSRYLQQTLFEEARSVVMTSATLATKINDFSFLARDIGFHGETLQLPSPFDFTRQSMLVIPDKEMKAPPNSDGFAAAAAEVTQKIVEQAGGRTLLLYTSWKNLRAVRDLVKNEFPYKLLVQGEGPVRHLVEQFKSDETSCLMGVASLWTGLDVPGRACVCVVVDKIPFPPKDDPICDWHDRNSGGMDYVFGQYMLPKALITLRQGVGRLIRSKTDYGVVVLLDKRVHKARYKRDLMSALPRFGTVWQTTDGIRAFLERAAAEFDPPRLAAAPGASDERDDEGEGEGGEDERGGGDVPALAPMDTAMPMDDGDLPF